MSHPKIPSLPRLNAVRNHPAVVAAREASVAARAAYEAAIARGEDAGPEGSAAFRAMIEEGLARSAARCEARAR